MTWEGVIWEMLEGRDMEGIRGRKGRGKCNYISIKIIKMNNIKNHL